MALDWSWACICSRARAGDAGQPAGRRRHTQALAESARPVLGQRWTSARPNAERRPLRAPSTANQARGAEACGRGACVQPRCDRRRATRSSAAVRPSLAVASSHRPLTCPQRPPPPTADSRLPLPMTPPLNLPRSLLFMRSGHPLVTEYLCSSSSLPARP